MIAVSDNSVTLTCQVTDWSQDLVKDEKKHLNYNCMTLSAEENGVTINLSSIFREKVTLSSSLKLIIKEDTDGLYKCSSASHSAKFNTDSYSFIDGNENQDNFTSFGVSVPSSIKLPIDPTKLYSCKYEIND